MSAVTVLRTERDRANKLFKRAPDGSIEKVGGVALGSYTARTRPCPDADALAAILAEIGDDPRSVLMLGTFKGAPEGEFTVWPRKRIAKRLKVDPKHASVEGWHDLDGSPVVARLKANTALSPWFLLDRDLTPDTPPELAAMTPDEWRAAMARIIPGLQDAAQVLVPSSSARVLDGGKPWSGAGGGLHLYAMADDPAQLARAWPQMLVCAFGLDLGFNRLKHARDGSGRVVAKQPWAIYDPSTCSPERLVYDGAPIVEGKGVTLSPPAVQVVQRGGTVPFAAMPDPPEEVRAKAKARGVTTARDGGAKIDHVVSATLALDLDLQTEAGVKTVRELWLEAAGKTRCQAAFRDSDSWAAYYNTHTGGEPFLFDTGGATKYVLPQTEPGPTPEEFHDVLVAWVEGHGSKLEGPALIAEASRRIHNVTGAALRHGWDPVAIGTLEDQLAAYMAKPLGQTKAALRDTLRRQARKETKTKAAGAGESDGDCPYEARTGGIYWLKKTAEGATPVRLTNFTARISAEVERDDGVERTLRFEVEGSVAGRPHVFTVTSSEFSGLAWAVREMGARAIVNPGFAIKDRARAAIQALSGDDIARKRIYAHTGWRVIDDSPAYLHSGGAIDAGGLRSDVETDLGELSRFNLPAPPEGEDLGRALAASIRVLDVGRIEVTAPGYAAVWRAVLGTADFGVHLLGATGIFKSELAALCQQHFGATLDARHLASWSSTANSLEAGAFSAKDALYAVDDFAPGGTQIDVQKMHREAGRLYRAQGNNQGRQRMRPDGSLRAPKPPRGLILSTGEDVPGGESVRGRMLIVDVSEGDIDSARLTACQRDAAAGLHAETMAAYLRHLAADLDGARARYRAERDRLADEARGRHRRTPRIVSELGAGLLLFLEFAGAVDQWQRCWSALQACALAQAAHQAEESPAVRFAALIWSALSSKRAHVADRWDPRLPPSRAGDYGWIIRTFGGADNARDEWQPQGPCIGWTGGGLLHLDPHAAFSMANRLANEEGRALGVGIKTLWKRLREAGLLARRNGDRNTYKVQVGERERNTITLALSVRAEAGEAGDQFSTGRDVRESADPSPDSTSRFSGARQESGDGIGRRAQGNGGIQGAWPGSPASPAYARTERAPAEEKICAFCGEPIPAGPHHTAISSGGQLHNACVDAWASKGEDE